VNYNKKPINPIPNESLLQACSSEMGVNLKGKRTMTSVDGNEGECEWNSFFHHLVAEELIFVLPYVLVSVNRHYSLTKLLLVVRVNCGGVNNKRV